MYYIPSLKECAMCHVPEESKCVFVDVHFISIIDMHIDIIFIARNVFQFLECLAVYHHYSSHCMVFVMESSGRFACLLIEMMYENSVCVSFSVWHIFRVHVNSLLSSKHTAQVSHTHLLVNEILKRKKIQFHVCYLNQPNGMEIKPKMKMFGVWKM